ncbi:DNA glycosylase [Wallemia mellicola]|nr:DNA glycosylase [Wallemia mellicola]TIC12448.1 DNA glycosylase [Wallemia mellicola]
MVEIDDKDTKRAPLKRSASSFTKQKRIQRELDVPHEAPENWETVYDLIKEMRSTQLAPVDTLGCERAPTENLDARNYLTSHLQVLTEGLDAVTSDAVNNLREQLEGGLTLESVLAATDKQIHAIAKVGFWRRKTEYLKKAAVMLRDNFEGDVPKDIDELCSLPGVGPKMGFLALQAAWNQNDGIGVDVHVHRITNRLGWHQPPTKQPEQTRLNLESWLPKELHRDVNKLLVGFGQTICLPVGPKCEDCKLSAEDLCPSARKFEGKKNKRRKTTELKREETEEERGEQLAKLEIVLEGERT